ncbi:MAG: PTS system mannose/fructose/sorbose family transporter subunit IID [Gemmatimonadetes bacterium]|nr:PTS system mannose/fructose/sorbose family transporter subunit IID [Gemmatimonadota bacterium]MDA1104728.1 PTS system mannose/fructose/sorbose family transporter subunit IID [Gemmatimonadota bacterium]
MSRDLPRRVVAATFARSFLIQGSWNYHTMLGSGFAFAMLPGLRRLFGSDPDQMDAAVARHLEHFNAHPYLSNLALGAVLRLEADGSDPEAIRRFKVAVRGPLGSLGDALVWATWLPAVAVLALSLYWLGAPGWAAALFFVLVYNVGHIGLRAWSFRLGLAAGRDVGRHLGKTDLTGWTARLEPVLVGSLGLLVGSALAGRGGLVESGGVWVALAAAGFLVGMFGGHRVWRPAAALTVAAIGLVALFGVWQ